MRQNGDNMGTSPSTVRRSGERRLPSLCPFLRVRKTSEDDLLHPSTPIKTFLGHLIGWNCIPCPFRNPSLQGNGAHFPHTPQACSPTGSLNTLGRFIGHLLMLSPWNWKAFLIFSSCFSVAQLSLTLVIPRTHFSI